MSSPSECEVYVCNNVDCRSRGAEKVLAALRAEFAADVPSRVQIHTYMCFSACNSGPNVVIPSRRCWLSSVRPEDAGAVRQVVEGGEPAPRLREKNDPDLETLIVGIIDAGLLSPDQGER